MAGKTEQRKRRKAARPSSNRNWRRRYYVPADQIQRAARDLLMQSTHHEIEDYAGRMFALQDLVDNQELDKFTMVENESDNRLFREIVKAVRREALTGDPEYARSIAGEFLEEAFRGDLPTVRLWTQYQNRIRQRRIDAGLGLIDPPDKTGDCAKCREASEDKGADLEQPMAETANNGTVAVCLRFNPSDPRVIEINIGRPAPRP